MRTSSQAVKRVSRPEAAGIVGGGAWPDKSYVFSSLEICRGAEYVPSDAGPCEYDKKSGKWLRTTYK